MRRRQSILRGVFKALLAGCLLTLGSQVYAASSDAVTVTVTPGGYLFGVQISSPELQGYDFSSVNLGASTISTLAIHVLNTGTISEYLALGVSNTSPDNWSAIPTGTPGYNQFEMLGHFVATNAGQPADSAFNVNSDTMTASIPSVAAGRYGQTRTDPGNSVDLYLKLVMPQSVTTSNQQHMTLTINGQAN